MNIVIRKKDGSNESIGNQFKLTKCYSRIADLRLLEVQQQGQSVLTLRKQLLNLFWSIEDEWERFIIHFTIYYPLKDSEIMRINGDLPELGSWNKGDPKTMT